MKTNIRAWLSMVVMGGVLVGAFVIGMQPRLREREALALAKQELAAAPRVHVVKIKAGSDHLEVTLPGTSAPFRISPLFAKTTGFVRRNLVDVGDHVVAGQLLAEIGAAETAQEIRLAQARVLEAKTNLEIVKLTASRAKKLAGVGAVSIQHSDDARAQENSAVATLSTRKAELQRLVVIRGYQKIHAPFDGIITRRGTDPGGLVGPSTNSGGSLFEVADIKQLRVSIEVPDAYAALVRIGDPAVVFSPHTPNQKVNGKVARTSGVLAQGTRTLRVEVHIPGRETLLPGSFVYVKLRLKNPHPAPRIPANALLVRKEGTLVAKVDAQGKITIVPITIGHDSGKELEVLSGISPGEEVVINGSDELTTGQHVQVIRK
jgi:RND family efflux transporter MFP subunit